MQKLRASRYWPWLRDFALLAVFYVGVRAYQQRALPSGPAPQWKSAELRGHDVSLRAYRGRPVLLHFWATWCAVCRAEESNIVALAKDLPVLTVASQSGTTPEVLAYAREHGLTFPIVPDEAGALARRYGVTSFPTTFILDAKGNVRHAEVGYTTELGLRLRMGLAGF